MSGSFARSDPKTEETAATTIEVLRRCPLVIVWQLVYYAIFVSTAVRNRVTKTMSIAPLLRNN